MIKRLIALVRMQQLDDIITEKEVLKKRIPLQLEELEKNLIEAQTALDEAKKKLEKNMKEKDKIELELKSNQEKIEKYEGQLTQIKNNKEYKALNDEISFLKNKNSEFDDKMLVLLEDEQEIKAHINEKKAEHDVCQKELDDKAEKLRRKVVLIEQEIEKTKEERKNIAKDLPVPLVKRYANLIIHKNRKAVVFVNTSNGCGGCGFSIRPQMLIDISKKDAIVSCESCGRMIVSEEVVQEIDKLNE